jgi:hypothetical protein
MTVGNVETRSNRGQWETVVAGRPDLSASYGTRDEAVEAGDRLADEMGVDHIVHDEDNGDGVSTDEIV